MPVGQVVEDLQRVVSLLEDYVERGEDLTDLDAGELLMLRQADQRVKQVIAELVGDTDDVVDPDDADLQEEGAA